MSSGTEANSPEPEGLQFDRAEYDEASEAGPSALSCAGCKRTIADHYYEINGTVVCEPCRQIIMTQLRSGSGFLRFLKAGLFGSGAAILGAGIYFSIIHFFHIEAALASILCGFLVGKAVRKGSDGRGGWAYQGLAILLTYLAIGFAYSAAAFATEGFQGVGAVAPGEVPPPKGVQILSISILIAFVGVVSPVVIAKESVISLVIIVFALWEAWKLTRASKLVVTGPYQVGQADPVIGDREDVGQ